MVKYMASGEIITPPFGRWQSYALSSNDSSSDEGSQSDKGLSSFEIYNSTSLTSSTANLDVVEDSTS